MLSQHVIKRGDVDRIASYYGDSEDDYYAKEGESQEWQGKGAEALGLTGAVDSATFRKLLAGEIGPDEKSRTSTRLDSNQRLGIDLTFSAPKSVAIQALVGGDVELIKAHDEAVRRTLEKIEALAQAKTKTKGVTSVETTGNLIIAKFRHETTREKQPLLHTHAVALNLTQREDGKWRALKNDAIIAAIKVMGPAYRAELADILQKQGRELRFGRDGTFELASYSRKQIESFSTRGQQIESRLAEKGLTRETASSEQKQVATMETRNAKERNIDRAKLHVEWKHDAQRSGIDFERARPGSAKSIEHTAQREHGDRDDSDAAARAAVRYAVKHLAEREAVIGLDDLRNTAVNHGVGTVTLARIDTEIGRQVKEGRIVAGAQEYRSAAEVNGPRMTQEAIVAQRVLAGADASAAAKEVRQEIRAGNFVETEQRYTTPKAIERERSILNMEREGRGKLTPILPEKVATELFARAQLNDGQREAATLMLTTANRVVGVQGYAGTGKSHMLDTAKAQIEEAGFSVRVLAPYGSQVKALRELNVEANTLASFLQAKEKGLTNKTVLVVDEAGTVPARQMQQLLQLAEKAGARVVMMGDTAQTKAIEAGKPFDQLQAAGMTTARMVEIMRQKDAVLKEAVELAAEGKARTSVQKISDVRAIEDDRERYKAVATEYTSLAPEDRAKTIIVTGINEARRDINRNVREQLSLEGNGEVHTALTRRDTTQAERGFAKNYDVGDTIQPERDYPKLGLKAGELYKVLDNAKPGNVLTVRGEDGSDRDFSPAKAKQLSVYETTRLEFAPGDLVRVTRNDAARDLANGERYTVTKTNADSVTISDGKRAVELPTSKPIHLDHAYATTVHSSQGLTEDRVLIDAKTTSRTTAQDVYYVAISRARHVATIFTENLAKLPAAVARISEKTAALDLGRARARFEGKANPGAAEKGNENQGRDRAQESQRRPAEKAAEREHERA